MKPRTSQLAQTGASTNDGLVWNGSLWLPAAVVNSLNGNTGALKAYATVADEGSSLTQRPTLNFIGSSVAAVDNSGSTRTDVTVTAYNTVQDEGSGLTQRPTLNFIGNAVAAADNSGSSRTDVTINALTTVQDEGSGLTQRPILDFVGAGVTASDDAGNGRTVITISGGGGGGTLGNATSYNPIWTGATTNPNIGNGTLTGEYIQAEKCLIVAILMIAGSTTTYGTGAWQFSLPGGITLLAMDPASSSDQRIGVTAYDTSASFTYAGTGYGDATSDAIQPYRGAGANDPMKNTAPFTWATGDRLLISATLFTN